MKILLGSDSERKIDVVKQVFKQYFKQEEIEIFGIKANSGVSETPYGEETYQGAKNRALFIKKESSANYYVGLESGLVERYGHLYEEAWAVIVTSEGTEFAGYSSGLTVPDYITNRMQTQAMEHYEAMALIEKELGELPNDTWGTYSGGQIARKVSLEEALRNAVIQILPHEGNLYTRRASLST